MRAENAHGLSPAPSTLFESISVVRFESDQKGKLRQMMGAWLGKDLLKTVRLGQPNCPPLSERHLARGVNLRRRLRLAPDNVSATVRAPRTILLQNYAPPSPPGVLSRRQHSEISFGAHILEKHERCPQVSDDLEL